MELTNKALIVLKYFDLEEHLLINLEQQERWERFLARFGGLPLLLEPEKEIVQEDELIQPEPFEEEPLRLPAKQPSRRRVTKRADELLVAGITISEFWKTKQFVTNLKDLKEYFKYPERAWNENLALRVYFDAYDYWFETILCQKLADKTEVWMMLYGVSESPAFILVQLDSKRKQSELEHLVKQLLSNHRFPTRCLFSWNHKDQITMRRVFCDTMTRAIRYGRHEKFDPLALPFSGSKKALRVDFTPNESFKTLFETPGDAKTYNQLFGTTGSHSLASL